MPFRVSIDEATQLFPEYEFLSSLTPSEQKAAFHVRDSDGRSLCLKMISPDYEIDRLNREIEALQQITHPNVVRLEEYTYSSKPGRQRHFMVEEYVDGHDLASHLQDGEPWPRPKVASFFEQLCGGLEALRCANVVHRDLKPNNIRVRLDESPVIIDFGLARLLSLPDLTNTEEGASIGTPIYFAPEQFEGTKREIDHRTDLFALGILAYQAAVGRHPFWEPSTTWEELRSAICEGEAHLNSEGFLALPRRWQIVLGRLLSKERADRPSSADQVGSLFRLVAGI